MNILIISYDFCLEAGGIQNTSYLLAKELAKYANVFTLCPANGNSPNLDGVKTFKSKFANTIEEKELYYKESVIIAEDIYNKYRLDYILCLHYSFSRPALYLKRKYKVSYGIMTYGNDVMKFPASDFLSHPRSTILSIIQRRIFLNNSTHIFSCSNYTKELVKKLCSNNSLYVIHPPINLKLSAITLPIEMKNNMILSIGRLVERKGYQNVIKALPYVLKEYPMLKYVIAGTGEYEHELKKLVIDLNLSDKVFFVGRVSEEEKCELLKQCGLFIMPSFMIKKKMTVEGFGLSLLEANLLGKFVISSKSGGIPEAVIENKTGFLVKEKDINGIANAITNFYMPQFVYNPQECIDWANSHHISSIARQYWTRISSI